MLRLITFAVVAILHVALIMFVAFRMETAIKSKEPVAGIMRLVELQEYIPPPPPERPPEEPQRNTQELIAAEIASVIAAEMIEVEEIHSPATKPAELNGVPIAVQFRYPVRFSLR